MIVPSQPLSESGSWAEGWRGPSLDLSRDGALLYQHILEQVLGLLSTIARVPVGLSARLSSRAQLLSQLCTYYGHETTDSAGRHWSGMTDGASSCAGERN